ncbi:unnamed protein product [Phytophthora fragariaefolia]|uniref:Unnamed protein product n=1 Tax=Phytophthora fragariaefolia TaxID=1490495 RepID=A0A9W6XJ91_9STRA|nr:unnamed protein product [Phytophthora fragariaefolia]
MPYGGIPLKRLPLTNETPMKLKSLATKLLSIPTQHLKYYTDVPDAIATVAQADAYKNKDAIAVGAPKC